MAALLIGILGAWSVAPARAGAREATVRPARELTELSAAERRELDEELRRVRAEAIAAARRALADPAFVAAARGIALRAAAATGGGATDQNEVAVPLQLASGMLYFYGTSQIKKAILEHFGVNFGVMPPRLRRFTPSEAKDLNPARRLAIGAAAVGASAALAYLSPPVAVEEGFRGRRWHERVAIVAAFDFQLPGPPVVELDVDDPTDPASCTATLRLASDGDGNVTDFGRFEERELAWTHPFGRTRASASGSPRS